MKKICFPAIFICLALISACSHPEKKKIIPPGDPMEDDAEARNAWEFKRLAGPDGTIPDHMREKELAYSATLPNDRSVTYGSSNERTAQQATWSERGPWNVGGRTRALGIDKLNENHLIAGTTCGGIWNSNDGGSTWTEVTPPGVYHGITCLEQDKRPGHESTWYAGSGEAYGQSASGGSAYYLGNGMLKSTDNGATWTPITVTVSNTPQSFDTFWDMNWDLALDGTDTANDIVYTACLGAVYKSVNGGTSWTPVRGGNLSNYSYFTDVAVTKDSGIVYATMSSDGPDHGIWRSADKGATWSKISTAGFGDTACNRVVMGFNPMNEHEIYFLGNTNGIGMPDTNFQGDIEWNVLWRYTYLGGDGTGSGGMWEDLSANLPSAEHFGQFGDFNAQGSYDLVVRVKPDDPNTVFIGGTNIFRNTNRFNDTASTSYIGGYLPYSALPVIASYPDHHPDQHMMTFLPSDPNVMFSTNDGGIFKTTDCTQSTVSWTSLDNGYITSMFYTVAVDHATPGNDIVIGGAQDNGSWWTNTTNLTTPWVSPRSGDGSYCAIADNQSAYYFSIQNGKMMRALLDGSGNVTSFARIDPIGGKGYQFINPFVIDPNNNNIMYLAGGKYLWRNDNLAGIPMAGNWDSISTNWVKWNDSVPVANVNITALAVSKTPANRVYYGTELKRVYRVDNANTGTPTPVDITPTSFPSSGFVSCVAVNPNDADQVMVVFSNYQVYSLFYSADGGTTWTKVAGNLEQVVSGGGNGPSLRWASFLPVSDGMIYLVSSSTGIYATDTLNGTATVWTRQGDQTIGTIVCDMTDVRISDGLVVLATHAHGIFSTHLTSVNDIVSVHENATISSAGINVYPNPAGNELTIAYTTDKDGEVQIQLLDELGRVIRNLRDEKQSPGNYSVHADVSGLAAGMYYVRMTTGTSVNVKPLVVQH
ncbi:MAG TPA: T9SS type A sorting domain-containing protein [Bacteroidia bacterium]|nr:T9SS type A sorting domain-containing protein [Bacteroidia bacterium]